MDTLEKSLLEFLVSIDHDFNPPLSSKVELHDYVAKIMASAELMLDYDCDKVIGKVVVYCNDYAGKKAYIPLVGVLHEYRNKGVAKKLMSDAILLAEKRDFSSIGIHSNNPVAVRLYESLGFVVVEHGERSYLEKTINIQEK